MLWGNVPLNKGGFRVMFIVSSLHNLKIPSTIDLPWRGGYIKAFSFDIGGVSGPEIG